MIEGAIVGGATNHFYIIVNRERELGLDRRETG